MGVLVMTIGMIGIFGMQSLAIQTNRAAYDMRVATELAETTLERLSRDTMQWTAAGAWPANTYLEEGMRDVGAWTAPPVVGTLTFNDLGLPGVTAANTADQRQVDRNSRYCLNYRTDWVRAPRLIRVEVLVTWPRTAAGEAILLGDCSNLVDLDAALLQRNFQTVQVTTMLGSNPVVL
jgi:hypothetical protein